MEVAISQLNDVLQEDAEDGFHRLETPFFNMDYM